MVQAQEIGKETPLPAEKIPMPLRMQNHQAQCLAQGKWRPLTSPEIQALDPDDLKNLRELKVGEELTIQY